jgi:D-sedoheptulose 7-phosphate isomerase
MSSEAKEFAKNLHIEFDAISACFTALKGEAQIIAGAADVMTKALRAGKKIIFCGNGGSAADSQHLAAELVGRYLKDRAPLPAIALTVDTSALTAIANDYSFDVVFARQLLAIGKLGDVLVAVSTSGNSANVIAALKVAKDLKIKTIGLTGADGGQMRSLCDVCIRVPARATNRIQEMHIAVGHALCGAIEHRLCSRKSHP